MLERIAAPVYVVLLMGIFLSVLAACGAAPPEDEVDAPEHGKEEEIPPEVMEVAEAFWGAFAAGDRDAMSEHLSDDLEEELRLELGLRTLTSEHHIAHDSNVFAGFEDLEISVRAAERDGDRITASVVIEHPRISVGDFDAFSAALAEEVFRTADRGEYVDFRAEFSGLLDDWEVSTGETTVQMTFAGDPKALTIAEMDAPRTLFSSFAALREVAVCDGLHEAHIVLQEKEKLDAETPVTLDFRGEEIAVQNAHLPECAHRVTTLDIAGEIDISTARLIDALAEHPFDWEGLRHYLQMGPEDFLQSGEFLFTSDNEKLALTMTRPYAVATKDTAVGVLDAESGEVAFLDVIPGTVDHLAWSPDDEYLAFAWTEWGPGFVEVDIYLQDDSIRFTEVLREELTDPIERIRWSEDGRILDIDVRKDEDRVKTWSLDVRERDLEPK